MAVCLVVVSYLHNFVLGPRLQEEIRAGREQTTRPTLVVVGWISYGLTVSLPILGVALQRMVGLNRERTRRAAVSVIRHVPRDSPQVMAVGGPVPGHSPSRSWPVPAITEGRAPRSVVPAVGDRRAAVAAEGLRPQLDARWRLAALVLGAVDHRQRAFDDLGLEPVLASSSRERSSST